MRSRENVVHTSIAYVLYLGCAFIHLKCAYQIRPARWMKIRPEIDLEIRKRGPNSKLMQSRADLIDSHGE